MRAAAAARDGHQPHHRRRERRGGRGRCAHRRRRHRASPDAAAAVRYNHLSILPYPARYEQVWPLRGGGEPAPHPPDDAQMPGTWCSGCRPKAATSASSRRWTELPPAMLARFTLIDYDREMALVAVQNARHGRATTARSPDRAHPRRVALHHQPGPGELRIRAGGGRRLRRQGPGARLMEASWTWRDKGLTKSSAWCWPTTAACSG